MAGIGFELKKIFDRNSLGSRLYGYACATAIVSGPTFLAILMLLGMQRIATRGGDGEWTVLLSLITYAMLGALLTSSLLGQVLARFSADSLYRKDFGRIMPSLNGAFLVLSLPFGILYGWIVSTVSAIGLIDKILNWAVYELMTLVYLQMGYLTAIKKYRRLVLWFAVGVLSALGLSWIFVRLLNFPVITGVQTGLFLGYGILLTGNFRELYEEFPAGYGTSLKFLTHVIKYPELLVSGFFSIGTSFIHILIGWFGEYGMQVSGALRAAPFYDAASFYAFLVQIPTNILFVVSVEVNFYKRYEEYFDAVSLNGTLRDIDLTRENMRRVLKNELLKLEVIQLIVMMAYMFFMRFYLETIGFTQSLLINFYLLCIGYAAFGVGVCLVLLLLYFDDTFDAALVSFVSFLVCGGVTLLLLHQPAFYGLGLVTGGLVMLILGMVLLDRYLEHIDQNVFCRQPVFIVEKANPAILLIDRIDAEVIRRQKEAKQRPGEKKGKNNRRENTKDRSRKYRIQEEQEHRS